MSKKAAPAPYRAHQGPKKYVAKPKVTCAKQKAVPRKKPPCDFDRVNLKCTHNPAKSDDSNSQREQGVVLYRKKGRYLYDTATGRGKGDKSTLVFEMIAKKQPKGYYYDLIRLVIGGGPGFKCSNKHPHVIIRDRQKSRTHKGKLHVFAQAWRAGVPPSLWKMPWTIAAESLRPPINEYKIHVRACGVRPSGSPVKAIHALVRVYPAERYKITLTVPSSKKKSVAWGGGSQINAAGDWRTKGVLGARYTQQSVEVSNDRKGTSYKKEFLATRTRDQKVSTAQYTNTRRSGSGRQRIESKTETFDMDRPQGDQHTRTVAPVDRTAGQRRDSMIAGLSFTVNDDKVDTGAAAGRFVQEVIRFQDTIRAIREFIRNFQPQIGWKFTWDVEFLAGEVAAEWGWKEDIDHAVYLWWKVSGELTVLSAVAEISFGIELWKVGISVFGALSGSLKFDKSFEGIGKRDDGGTESGMGISGTIGGRVGVRAVAGANWFKGEASIGVSLTPRFQIRFFRKFQMVCRTGWSGMIADMELSSKALGYKRKQSHEIIAPDPSLAEFTWPRY